MISDELKSRLLQWHQSSADSRDYHDGLALLAEVSGNRSYLFTIRSPEGKKCFIDYQLTKYIRLVEETALDVKEIDRKVSDIVEKNLSLAAEKDEAPHRGRRDDHDTLPDDIKALYIENLDILRQIRDIHMRLRLINEQESSGAVEGHSFDSERLPFLKSIIDLDKKMHDNWKKYDTYSRIGD